MNVTISKNPQLGLYNGALRQGVNGALPVPRNIRIPQARTMCEAFGLDFESTDSSVPCYVVAGYDICVSSESLAAWIAANLSR